MRISDWSSDVCSSDLQVHRPRLVGKAAADIIRVFQERALRLGERGKHLLALLGVFAARHRHGRGSCVRSPVALCRDGRSHHPLFNLAAAAPGASHPLAPTLFLPLFGRTEPFLAHILRRPPTIPPTHSTRTRPLSGYGMYILLTLVL